MSLSNKEILITSGFPRSGNTFLNFALWQLYYPKEKINNFFHTTKVVKNNNKIIMPIRNPLDCISSWHNFLEKKENLSASCKYYLRFHKEAIEKTNNIVFLDFNYMIFDIEYIKNVISNNYNIETKSNITVSTIKELMFEKKRSWNLPKNNQDFVNKTKDELKSLEHFNLCIKLYYEIKSNATLRI